MPFRLSVPLSAMAPHAAWRRAQSELLASVAEDGRTLLLGEPGTGKTMLLQSIASAVRDSERPAKLMRPGDDQTDWPDSSVLLVDEADGLDDAALQSIYRLPNPMVLAGLPSMRERAARQVGVIGTVRLEAVSPDDIARFIEWRLAASGRPASLFTPDAIDALARLSGGVFRALVVLASASLFFAEQRSDGPVVTTTDVEAAASMRAALAAPDRLAAPGLDAPLPRQGSWRPWA